jgi:hypothetical protein
MAFLALVQKTRKLDRRSRPPFGPTKTSPSSPACAKRQPPVVHFGRRYGDPDRARVEIQLAPPQPGQLPEPQAGERREQQQRPVPRRHLVEQLDQGLDRNHRPLGRILLADALDPARVTADQPVFDGRIHDRVQQPVRLGHRDRPERPSPARPRIEAFLPHRRTSPSRISPRSMLPKTGARWLPVISSA